MQSMYQLSTVSGQRHLDKANSLIDTLVRIISFDILPTRAQESILFGVLAVTA